MDTAHSRKGGRAGRPGATADRPDLATGDVSQDGSLIPTHAPQVEAPLAALLRLVRR